MSLNLLYRKNALRRSRPFIAQSSVFLIRPRGADLCQILSKTNNIQMANTYTQLYAQLVFAVKGRQSLIEKQHRERLHQIITGIIQNRGQKMLAVFCMPDHVHILIGFKPSVSLSDLVRDIKTNTTLFIKENRLSRSKFEWQAGFGAFTYAHSQVDAVCKYIMNQEDHHKTRSFRAEYLDFLEKFEVLHEERYLFEWIDG